MLDRYLRHGPLDEGSAKPSNVRRDDKQVTLQHFLKPHLYR